VNFLDAKISTDWIRSYFTVGNRFCRDGVESLREIIDGHLFVLPGAVQCANPGFRVDHLEQIINETFKPALSDEQREILRVYAADERIVECGTCRGLLSRGEVFNMTLLCSNVANILRGDARLDNLKGAIVRGVVQQWAIDAGQAWLYQEPVTHDGGAMPIEEPVTTRSEPVEVKREVPRTIAIRDIGIDSAFLLRASDEWCEDWKAIARSLLEPGTNEYVGRYVTIGYIVEDMEGETYCKETEGECYACGQTTTDSEEFTIPEPDMERLFGSLDEYWLYLLQDDSLNGLDWLDIELPTEWVNGRPWVYKGE
jgi:hypothetical protein